MSKFKTGDRVRVKDAPTILEGRRDWVGKELTLANPDNWDEPAWNVVGAECWYRFRESELELASPSPVREVTRKEIVPGLYSHIRVWPNSPHGHVRVSIQEMAGGHAAYDFHPSELRAAADVLTQLADALEPKP